MQRDRGMTLIDVIVGTALLLVVFLALFGVLKASLSISTLAKTKAAAAALAENQMEYLRGLSYTNIGTVGGIPSGAVAQDATSTVDGVSYLLHTFIEYYDDPADGTSTHDTNGITTDYKIAEATVSWNFYGVMQSITLLSDFSPPGMESSNGGGTLAVDVVNAAGAPVDDAQVTIINASTSPTVNLTTYTNDSGVVYLPGAVASSQYQIAVSKSGYSSAQTYARAGANQNPSPGYLTISNNQTTTGTFAIDLLTPFQLTTYAVNGASTTPSVAYTLTGAKTIGSTSGGAPIYKTTVSGTTDTNGSASKNLEWDSYALAVSGADVIDACPLPPYELTPGVPFTATVTLATSTTNSILVAVADASGNPVAGAQVELQKTGYDHYATTTACGNAYFGTLSATNYSATISKSGYTTTNFSSVPVAGDTFYPTSFP